MNKIAYLATRIFKMNYAAMFKTAVKISRQAHKFAPVVFADMVKCGLKYSAGYVDYEVFEFYNLNAQQRETYITRGISNRLVLKYNERQAAEILDNKTLAAKVCGDLLGREWLDAAVATDGERLEFAKNHNPFFAKPPEGSCGQGIEKVTNPTAAKLEELVKKGITHWEETVVQHAELSELAPNSVNTVRFYTLYNGGKCHILRAVLKLGAGNHVDNLNAGGVAALINIETGKVISPAVGKYADSHPYGGDKLIGFQVPLWDETKIFLFTCAERLKKTAYIGWDVAITPGQPLLIEANPYPGHDLMQLPIFCKIENDSNGILPKIQQIARDNL